MRQKRPVQKQNSRSSLKDYNSIRDEESVKQLEEGNSPRLPDGNKNNQFVPAYGEEASSNAERERLEGAISG